MDEENELNKSEISKKELKPNNNNKISKRKQSLKVKEKKIEIDNKIVNTISELLNNMCKENNTAEANNYNISSNKKILLFMLKKVPSISIKDFLIRLLKYSKINDSTFVYILIIIDRFCRKYMIKINYYNIYKLILVSLVIAVKLNEDEYYSSEFYAKIGGISKVEMNKLEYELSVMINFDFFVKEELFYKYYDLLNYSNEEG